MNPSTKPVQHEFGRFHSNYTNMKGELRQELTFNGERLVGIDISNSQPSILPFILGRHIGEIRQTQEGGGSIVGEEFSADLDIKSEIQTVALSLGVIFGSFYERVGVSLAPPITDRNMVKALFFESLYGNLDTTKNSRIFKQIKKVSPPFAAAILDIKKDKHQELSHQLQQVESQIVIEGCCRSLMQNFPSIPLLTVHDEIMTTKQFEGQVVIELQRAFFDTCGYFCALSTG